MKDASRTILHVDMDAFYASIEQRDQPGLRGRPVVVGSPPDQRGVVSAASYEARRFGIRSAMPSRTAGTLCRDAVFLPVDMEKYRAVSAQLMDLFAAVTPFVEPLSIDEAFLDVTGVLHAWPHARALAAQLKERIRKELALTASVGIAPNLFLAKLASAMEKPDGLTETPFAPREIEAFLAPLAVETIWGIGPKSAERLHRSGIQSVGDLQPLSESFLIGILGSSAMARHVRRLSHGIDERRVQTEREAKSVSSEYTFLEDCDRMETCRQRLIEQVERVGRRLREKGLVGTTGFIKIRLADFTTFTRQEPLLHPSNMDHDLLACSRSLFDRLRVSGPVRLVGFGVTGLCEGNSPVITVQPLLFPELDESGNREADRDLDRAVDRIRTQYGPKAIKRGDWSTRKKGDDPTTSSGQE